MRLQDNLFAFCFLDWTASNVKRKKMRSNTSKIKRRKRGCNRDRRCSGTKVRGDVSNHLSRV